MIRKQIYLKEKQDRALKRQARERGVSEAEVIRQAIDLVTEAGGQPGHNSQAALDGLTRYALSLRKRGELHKGKPYKFSRDEEYKDRERRK